MSSAPALTGLELADLVTARSAPGSTAVVWALPKLLAVLGSGVLEVIPTVLDTIDPETNAPLLLFTLTVSVSVSLSPGAMLLLSKQIHTPLVTDDGHELLLKPPPVGADEGRVGRDRVGDRRLVGEVRAVVADDDRVGQLGAERHGVGRAGLGGDQVGAGADHR